MLGLARLPTSPAKTVVKHKPLEPPAKEVIVAVSDPTSDSIQALESPPKPRLTRAQTLKSVTSKASALRQASKDVEDVEVSSSGLSEISASDGEDPPVTSRKRKNSESRSVAKKKVKSVAFIDSSDDDKPQAAGKDSEKVRAPQKGKGKEIESRLDKSKEIGKQKDEEARKGTVVAGKAGRSVQRSKRLPYDSSSSPDGQSVSPHIAPPC
jgi:hypothetical protein